MIPKDMARSDILSFRNTFLNESIIRFLSFEKLINKNELKDTIFQNINVKNKLFEIMIPLIENTNNPK
tara:strand:- start:16918 stop:17121 length:204 start_codon:yes stop_codon:yes gene_type:complete